MKTFLMVSLVLNVLLVGVLLGETLHSLPQFFTQSAPIATTSTDCCAPELVSQLPQDKREMLESTLQPAWKKVLETHAKIDSEKLKALNLLKAEPFDEKAYRSQIRRISDMYTQMKRDMAESVTELAKEFTPQERVILADILAHLSVAPAKQAAK